MYERANLVLYEIVEEVGELVAHKGACWRFCILLSTQRLEAFDESRM